MVLRELCDFPPVFHGLLISLAPDLIPMLVQLAIRLVLPQRKAKVYGPILCHSLYTTLEGSRDNFKAQLLWAS